MTESTEVQGPVMDMLLMHPRVAWAMVITTGKVKIKSHWVTVGHYMSDTQKRKTGMTDIIGQLKDGRFFCIETKSPGKGPTTEQHEFLELVRRNGGIAGWADNVEDAQIIIDHSVWLT